MENIILCNLPNYILELLKIIVWPLLIFYFIKLFKLNISNLINRIKSIGYPGGQIDTNQNNAPSQNVPNPEDLIKSQDKQIKSLKTKSKNLKDKSINTIKGLTNILDTTNKWLEFERTYRLIFGTQITFLYFIDQNKQKIDRTFAENYFISFVKNIYPIPYQNWTIDTYLDFLFKKRLIAYNSTSYLELTDKGVNFLSYIKENNYPLKTL